MAEQRNLLVVRHAKSGWGSAGLPDRQRQLDTRGNRDGPRMAAQLASAAPLPDWVLVSDALRTRQTMAHLAAGMAIDEALVHYDPRLYLATVGTLYDVAAEAPDSAGTLMLVGHNNGITDFANSLAGQEVSHDLPTLAVVWFRLDLDHWHQLHPGCATVAGHWWPKALPDA